VTLKDMLRHEQHLQRIADANNDNRASGQPGYDASVDYVVHRLRKAGYDVTVQPYQFAYFERFSASFAQVAPVPTTYVEDVDFDLMDYSGSGDVTAPVVGVDLSLAPPRASTSGCQPADFRNADGSSKVAGKIALMQRGECGFGQKVVNAEAAGAVGAVMMNQGNGDPATNPDRYGLFGGTLGVPVGIPTVSVTYFQGEAFANTPGLVLRIQAETISTFSQTANVIAQTKHGRTDNVVLAGAHLDSVTGGPGINDNGSGVAALLEIAVEMAKLKTPNAVRFAWWGAEEAALQGSNHYVTNLSDAELENIALYLNFDMIASPNYTLGVLDGDDSAQQGGGPGPAGSGAIEAVFEQFFAAHGEPVKASDLAGRSDYAPFQVNGVPVGGLFTGAEVPKSADDVAKWGGIAGQQMDPCYHSSCDSLTPEQDGAPVGVHDALEASGYRLRGNLNTYAFDLNADAAATAIVTFAYDTSAVNG
jgi:Zn-dependent M28 family amino/carboxypeptidase